MNCGSLVDECPELGTTRKRSAPCASRLDQPCVRFVTSHTLFVLPCFRLQPSCRQVTYCTDSLLRCFRNDLRLFKEKLTHRKQKHRSKVAVSGLMVISCSIRRETPPVLRMTTEPELHTVSVIHDLRVHAQKDDA